MHALVPTRRCPRCQQHKPATAEHFDLGVRGKLATHCILCMNGARLPAKSGHRAIDGRAYDDLFARQGGACGCCGRPERLLGADGLPQRLSFYAHSAGRRALICFCCDLSCTGISHDATRAAQLAVFLGCPERRTTVAHVHRDTPIAIEGEVE